MRRRIRRRSQADNAPVITARSEPRSCLISQNGAEVPEFADFTRQFPTGAEVIDSNFDFAEHTLANQRDFAQRIVAAAK